MRTIFWLALLGAGCNKPDPLFGLADAPGLVDVGGDGGSGVCTGPTGSAWSVCVDPPAGPVVLGEPINTDIDTRCSKNTTWGMSGQSPTCVIAGTTITMTTDVTVSGSLPLVLVATETDITISHSLDASSHVGTTTRAPGARTNCGGTAGTAIGAGYGGGGAGGTFQTRGGLGGIGDNSAATNGGQSEVVGDAPKTLLGGCSGTSGIVGSGTPGGGGGALYLVAKRDIVVLDKIDASGAGARATMTTSLAGGSGGGSGGMIVLVGAQIRGTGVVFTNGGGGAAGSGDLGHPGGAGSDPAAPTVAAPGGALLNAGGGGPGGSGFALNLPAATGSSAAKGGGGGGGGAGWVYIVASAGNTISSVSPDATTTLP